MKRMMKSVVGVTLLEIMLVLAIAAMIIVMSVRYYQSATANQQANSALQIVQGITAAADGLAQASGSYQTVPVNTANVAALMPGGGTTIRAPWGGLVSVAATSPNTYTVTFATTPAAVCRILSSRLTGNPATSGKYLSVTTAATCGTSTAVPFVYTYNSQN